MMKKIAFILLWIFCFIASGYTQATINNARHKMAILTPLYLDDAFNASGSYLLSGRTFPKNSISGLEFYHGASIAVDSLNALNVPLDVYIYDSKSQKENLDQIFDKAAANGVELIIANTTINDLSKIASLAASKKITVINATIPNDGAATNNPYFIVMNPTLPTQGEKIYNYVKTNYPNQEAIFLTRKGNSEAYIKSVFETLNKVDRSQAMHIKYTDVKDSLNTGKELFGIDHTKPLLFVIGSLDVNFADQLLKQLSNLSKTYKQITVVGMPTWDNLNMTKYKGIEIVYSTPFYNPGTSTASHNISSYYNSKMYARPSDLVYRGFGLTYKFGRLLNQYGKDQLQSGYTGNLYKILYDSDIQPVTRNGVINYYENKKLYFLKYFNGSLKSVN